MECVKIRLYFSEYLDGTLDEQIVNLVEDHVFTCRECRKVLSSLQSLVQDLGDLEQVKAPKEFLEQVHARMAKRFDIRSLIKTLFIPFRIKIPYQFAAAAAMAVLIFFIIHTPDIEKEMTGIPKLDEEEYLHEPGPVKAESKSSVGKAVKPVELALILISKIPKSNDIPRIDDVMDKGRRYHVARGLFSNGFGRL